MDRPANHEFVRYRHKLRMRKGVLLRRRIETCQKIDMENIVQSQVFFIQYVEKIWQKMIFLEFLTGS